MTTSHLRTEYLRAGLDEEQAGDDPGRLFERWFHEAVAAGGRDPNAMSLATADASGKPDVRIVLCKEYGPDGFVFFTNYESAKGRELDANPNGCLLFYWPELERQVRASGTVHRVDAAESDAYFAQRPREARIGAWASPQSRVIAGRDDLEARVAEAQRRFHGVEHPPRPGHWGGYRLRPERLEFWQGRASRLHDRLCFVRAGEGWNRERLAP
jgi:pyridoxamine 5'-phosphate oxidase